MRLSIQHDLTELVRDRVHRLQNTGGNFDPLLDMIGNAHFVLLGEASHGTHEFYRARAEITKRLIEDKGFTAVCVEADWPDAYRVNRFALHRGEDADAEQALGDFKRFPTWMWRNADVLDFIGWLHAHNEHCGATKCGFYGMDLYSLYSSVAAVLKYLRKTDPAAAERAQKRYACFEGYDENSQGYGYAASTGLKESCEDAVVKELTDLRRASFDYMNRDGRLAEDEFFFAEQNARLIKNAEEYYRSMFRGRMSSWNLRDRHMMETLQALAAHLERQNGEHPRIVVWAHNSHLGNARHTQMGERGEWNVGQLVRDEYGADAVLIGFTTHHGSVSAASDWDGAVERKRVRPGMKGSYELLFHETKLPRFIVNLRDDHELHEALFQPKLERAIGVIYLPNTERLSHY
ncbi:MAG TPA: erythromycin esterase family protein, partial [Candidatus Acidoferrum sp.]|nr:erythromycin esterase family protein [Candidatus Acidoferrum sp.]